MLFFGIILGALVTVAALPLERQSLVKVATLLAAELLSGTFAHTPFSVVVVPAATHKLLIISGSHGHGCS